jgi:transposase InsO family protein
VCLNWASTAPWGDRRATAGPTRKYEDIYIQDYLDGLEAGRGLKRWFAHYNDERPHQAWHYATPGEVYFSPESYGAKPASWA